MTLGRISALAAASTAALVAAVAASAAALGVAPAHLTSTSAAGSVGASTCSLAVSSTDAYVDGTALQTSSNFGTSPNLLVHSSVLGNKRSFVRFGLASCGIPATARVTDATFGLFLSQAPLLSRTYEARRVTATWSETTVTWSNQPAVAGTPTATTATGTTSGVTLSWAVTTDVQAVVAGTATENGWRVADATEGAVVPADATFGSRERATASERPTLVVTYYP